MPRNVDVFKVEIETAIEKIHQSGYTIIPRRLIEEEIKNNREQYPKIGKLENVPLKMAISAVVNKRQDAKVYGKRPISWAFSFGSPTGVVI